MPLPKIISEETRVSSLLIFSQILKRATEKRASDLHLKAGLPPIVRVNGALYYLGDDAGEQHSRLTNEQLIDFAMSLMNQRQLERYENGEEVDLAYEIAGGGRFRINICQGRSNPRMVCRYIPDSIRTVQDLALPPAIEELARNQRGLILVTGATGSGKSTTLAAIIDFITRTRSCHIVTIEDPIEFVFKDRKSIVTQREIGMDTRSFAHALKYALRQDPDVILVGEMRDEETISMALNAAETGHLVLSTLHTSDARETVNRVLGMVSGGMQGAVRAQLSSVLIGVVSQRLLKRRDGRGRIAGLEILLSNQRVRDMISDPARTGDLHRVIEDSETMGMQTFDSALLRLYEQNLITKEEALNNCTNLRDFQMRIDGITAGWGEKEQHTSVTRADQVKELLQQQANPSVIEIEGVTNAGVQDPRRRRGG